MEWSSSVAWMCIDTRSLSQRELMTLSRSSLSTLDLRWRNEVVNPKIDPSLFNESAGSRRQTYSSPTGRRRRLSGILPAPTNVPPLPAHGPENRLIIDYLKHLIRDDPKFDQVQLAQPPSSHSQPINNVNVKRKRGRKPKVKVHSDGIDILNQNGVPVDLQQLANSLDPFGEELKRRSNGLLNEDELLGFLSNLPGQWGSRRKKRRIVDASDFAHVLPLGWKILLGLKRKDGRAWIYCRRYISPTGQHFVSCKEVASYLHSLLAQPHSLFQTSPLTQTLLHPAHQSAGVNQENQYQRQIVAANERLKEVALLGIENLSDVQIHDLFECRKCNMSFDEKDLYLQHLLSFHQRTTRRYRLGSSVGDGVIIKDGKFECQFCHKVFLERRRYNGHVGIHVRNYVRKVEDSPGQANVQKSPVREDVPLRISKMDALIEIAQNSIMEDSVTEPHGSAKLDRVPATDIAAGYLDQGRNSESPISEHRMEDSMIGKNTVHDLDENIEEVDVDNHVIDVRMVTFLDNVGLLSVNKQDANAPETSKVKDDMPLTIEDLDRAGMDLDDVSQNSLLPLSGHHIIPESGKSEISAGCANAKGQVILDEYKSELEFGLNGLKDVPVTVSTNVQEMEEKPDNVKGFQELRFDEIDTVECDSARVQDSPSLPDVPTELTNNTLVEGTCASSVQFESQGVMLNIGDRTQRTTVCVWCGIEFNHDALNSEIQPDSVGFMCPACKAKISGQVNVLDCRSPNAGCL